MDCELFGLSLIDILACAMLCVAWFEEVVMFFSARRVSPYWFYLLFA